MATPRERLNAAITFFFNQALPEATGKQLSQLPSAMVHPGAYAKASGAAVNSSYGQSITPSYVLRVHPAVTVAGQTPALTADVPQTGGTERHLLYTRQAADHKVDTEEEIARSLADMDSFAEIFGAAKATTDPAAPPPPRRTVVGGAAPPPSAAGATTPTAAATAAPAAGAARPAPRAADWAKAIVAARASLPDDLNALTAVPAALASVAGDIGALQTVLMQFFTFSATGKYYARWAGAGRDGSNPTHLTAEYKRDNVRELQLERECLYVYAVLPESLLAAGSALDSSAFREIVLRFDEMSESPRPFEIAAIHTAKWRRAEAPFCDFVFFYTQEGLGISIARDLRYKLSAPLQALLSTLAKPNVNREAVLQASQFTTKVDGVWYVHLHVAIDEDSEPAWPASILLGEEVREWNDVVAPIEAIPDLAAIPTVRFIGSIPQMQPKLDLALAEVSNAAYQTKLPADKRGGAGVIVGIIDTGIDGSHPAFGSPTRIHAVWDLDPPTSLTGKTPAKTYEKTPQEKAYKQMIWGIELTKTTTPHNTTHSQDPGGHGTHVASTAAGEEVKDSAGTVLVPAGVAPKATLVVVRGIGLSAGVAQQPTLAVQYILNKAKELKMPCVINMSFGSHGGGHDGTDQNTRKLYELLTTTKKKAYVPGRVIVAAAGNERDLALHVRRNVPKPAGGKASVLHIATLALGSLTPPAQLTSPIGVVVWIKNPFTKAPKNVPMGFMIWRQSMTTGPFPIPTFDMTPLTMLGENKTTSFPAINTAVSLFSKVEPETNGDFTFWIQFDPFDATKPMPRNNWNLQFSSRVDAALDLHMWVVGEHSTFSDATAADTAFLVGLPADGAATISVAACSTRIKFTTPTTAIDVTSSETLHDIVSFSSNGPLREASKPLKKLDGVKHEVTAVDVTAPGCYTLAALSSQAVLSAEEAPYKASARGIYMQGTSMATPLVTGLVANLLAKEPTLTMPQVLDRLKAASAVPTAAKDQPPAATGGAKPYSHLWGYGLIDASKLA